MNIQVKKRPVSPSAADTKRCVGYKKGHKKEKLRNRCVLSMVPAELKASRKCWTLCGWRGVWGWEVFRHSPVQANFKRIGGYERSRATSAGGKHRGREVEFLAESCRWLCWPPTSVTVLVSAFRIPCWRLTRGVTATLPLSQPHLS